MTINHFQQVYSSELFNPRLERTSFKECSFINCSFEKDSCFGTEFANCVFLNCHFLNGSAGVLIKNCVFSECKLTPDKPFRFFLSQGENYFLNSKLDKNSHEKLENLLQLSLELLF